MRWIDVALPGSNTCRETDRWLEQAATLTARLPSVQDREGLDSLAVTRHVAEIGGALFRAVTAHDPAAFDPAPGRDGGQVPPLGRAETDCLVGYHLVADPEQVLLPWHWLHNGLEFLLERHPICAAPHPSRVPEVDPPRLWMQRFSEDLFRQADTDASGAPDAAAVPEILFVPGHGNEEIRRLIFREADGIDQALQGAPRARARLRIPGAVTPGLLASRALLYQALHFAAPTSQAPEISGAGENRWLAGLIAAAGAPGAEVIDDMVGLEREVLGVDPVEAILDQVAERYERQGAAPQPAPYRAVGAVSGVAAGDRSWLLDDGPVAPEFLGRDGGLPPLIFSNSYCSLIWLGPRFLQAGASTFVGPAAPLYSRPARGLAALFYGFLSEGHCVGAALRLAALAVREELGADHPAWLAYGTVGYGSLSLQNL